MKEIKERMMQEMKKAFPDIPEDAMTFKTIEWADGDYDIELTHGKTDLETKGLFRFIIEYTNRIKEVKQNATNKNNM